MTPDKMPYIIYDDAESLTRKTHGCANIRENSSASKIGERHFLWIFNVNYMGF